MQYVWFSAKFILYCFKICFFFFFNVTNMAKPGITQWKSARRKEGFSRLVWRWLCQNSSPTWRFSKMGWQWLSQNYGSTACSCLPLLKMSLLLFLKTKSKMALIWRKKKSYFWPLLHFQEVEITWRKELCVREEEYPYWNSSNYVKCDRCLWQSMGVGKDERRNS